MIFWNCIFLFFANKILKLKYFSKNEKHREDFQKGQDQKIDQIEENKKGYQRRDQKVHKNLAKHPYFETHTPDKGHADEVFWSKTHIL